AGGVLQQLLTCPQGVVDPRCADGANDQRAHDAACDEADQYPSGDQHNRTSGSVPARGIPNLANPKPWRAAPRELLLVYVARWGRSLDVVSLGVARSIRKRSVQAKLSYSDSSS